MHDSFLVLQGVLGAGQNLTEKGLVNFLVLKLIYSGFNVLNLFTVGSTVNFKENCTFWFLRGPTFSRGGVKLNCFFPIELVIFLSVPVHD